MNDQDRWSIEERLRRLLMESMRVRADQLQANFIRTGIIDSAAVMELLIALECEFAIVIEDDDLVAENFETFQSIVSFVIAKNAAVRLDRERA